MYISCLDLPEHTRTVSIVLLQARLSDAIDLEAQIRQARWNTRGPHFFQLRQLFDSLHGEVEAFVETLAERIAALGGTPDGRLQTTASATSLYEYAVEAGGGERHLTAVAAVLAQFGKAARRDIERTAAIGDADTADVFTDISRDTDRQLWFIAAHLSPRWLEQLAPNVVSFCCYVTSIASSSAWRGVDSRIRRQRHVTDGSRSLRSHSGGPSCVRKSIERKLHGWDSQRARRGAIVEVDAVMDQGRGAQRSDAGRGRHVSEANAAKKPPFIGSEERRMNWIARFSIACIAGFVALAGICWAVVGSLGLDPGVIAPLILGITFTVGLGVGLMALVFYSNRSGQDEGARIEPPERRSESSARSRARE